jgi:hypothetical protein
VTSIVQAMKRFSHTASSEMTQADLNDAIETTLAVCRNEYKYVADIKLELGELPLVTCNLGEINQVLLNLIINAAQAIEEHRDHDAELGATTIRHPPRGRRGRHRRRRRRTRHLARGPGPHLRAVLHDQGDWQGQRSGAGARAHNDGPPFRVDRMLKRTREGDEVHPPPTRGVVRGGVRAGRLMVPATG